MSADFNQPPESGWGLAATLKIIAALVIMIIAGAGILLVLDMLTLEGFKSLAIKTALVGGVMALASVLLGLLSRSRE